MTYSDGWRGQTPIPDVRSHVANWSHFKHRTGVWPVLSITTYIMRYIIMIVGVLFAIRFAIQHNLTKDQGLIPLAAVTPIIYIWFFVERAAWNRDLRQKGVSLKDETWDTKQFPQK